MAAVGGGIVRPGGGAVVREVLGRFPVLRLQCVRLLCEALRTTTLPPAHLADIVQVLLEGATPGDSVCFQLVNDLLDLDHNILNSLITSSHLTCTTKLLLAYSLMFSHLPTTMNDTDQKSREILIDSMLLSLQSVLSREWIQKTHSSDIQQALLIKTAFVKERNLGFFVNYQKGHEELNGLLDVVEELITKMDDTGRWMLPKVVPKVEFTAEFVIKGIFRCMGCIMGLIEAGT